MTNIKLLLETFCQQQQLPSQYLLMAERWFLPLADEFAEQHQNKGCPLLIGINGCQGSGKSTLSTLLVTLLLSKHQKKAVILSIDDFYFTLKERQALASDIHPLFITRGVPGTHDIPLLQQVIQQLQHSTEIVRIPRFNKATDNRYPEDQWGPIQAPVDIILLEGWCVGSPAQSSDALKTAINTLESTEDQEGKWRNFSNKLLGNEYKALFDLIDTSILLKAPSFDCAYQWRQTQEDKLRETLSKHAQPSQGVMNKAQLTRFIEHYQRITEHTLQELPKTADVVFTLNDQQQITHRHNKHRHNKHELNTDE
jgi:D-glycerate 3-kinase